MTTVYGKWTVETGNHTGSGSGNSTVLFLALCQGGTYHNHYKEPFVTGEWPETSKGETGTSGWHAGPLGAVQDTSFDGWYAGYNMNLADKWEPVSVQLQISTSESLDDVFKWYMWSGSVWVPDTNYRKWTKIKELK